MLATEEWLTSSYASFNTSHVTYIGPTFSSTKKNLSLGNTEHLVSVVSCVTYRNGELLVPCSAYFLLSNSLNWILWADTCLWARRLEPTVYTKSYDVSINVNSSLPHRTVIPSLLSLFHTPTGSPTWDVKQSRACSRWNDPDFQRSKGFEPTLPTMNCGDFEHFAGIAMEKINMVAMYVQLLL